MRGDRVTGLRAVRIADVTAEALAEVNDKELLSLHRRCHQLAGSLFATARERAEDDLEGKLTWEDLVNAHALIVAEMEAREMNHNLRDRLDRESARVEKGAVSLEYLKARLAEAQDVVVVENFISIAGSVVQKGERAGDVDLVIRQDRRDPGLEILTRKVFDPEKRGYLHWVYQATGPHADYIPAFDLVLRPKREFKVHTVKAAPLKVDLGCGPNKPDGYFGIDKKYFEGVDQVWDLENGIPLPDESAEEVRAVHVLEHLSDPEHIMAEIWRVLVPGGKLVFEVPSTKGEGAWAHPGHKSGWNKSTFAFWTEEDLLENRPRFEVEQIEEETKGDLVYVRGILRKPLGEDVQKRAIKPIARFEMPKPAMKHYAQTEAFSPDEIWPWVERHLENGVVSEPKLNGFRCCIQKAGSRVSIYFEDAQEERNKQLPDLVAALERVNADFILDCNVGVEEGGRPWPRIKLMTLTADEPELPEGAYVKATLFDLVYWGEDIHTKPFRERRRALEEFYAKYLKHDRHFAITPQLSIRSHADLEAAWRRQGIQTPMSEGIVLKDLEAPYTLGPSTDALAKVKKMVEVKAWVLDVKRNRNGTYGFRGGLLLGDARFANVVAFRGEKVVDLGWSFNAPFKADVGDVVTFEVEEIIPQEKDGKEELAWLGAKPVDVDKTRTKPYFANQVVDIARRGGVLQKAAPTDEGETRAERAERFWKENWWQLIPKSGKGRFVLHAHWRGLSEHEAREFGMDELLKTNHSLHYDLRLEGDDALWGWSIFAGTTEENRPIPRIFKLSQEEPMRAAPKLAQPKGWLKVGEPPLIVEPGGVGSTSRTWSKFFMLDKGEYQVGVVRLHAVELFLYGEKLKGRYMFQYAEVPNQQG